MKKVLVSMLVCLLFMGVQAQKVTKISATGVGYTGKVIDFEFIDNPSNNQQFPFKDNQKMEFEVELSEPSLLKINAWLWMKDYTLTPGKQLTQGKATGSVAIGDIDPNEVTSWLKGYYIFKKARLQDVVSTLQNWYGVHIRLSGETSASTYYTGVVNKEEDIEIFLRRLEETSDVKCSKKGNTVTIY